jgi:hypothetical protein
MAKRKPTKQVILDEDHALSEQFKRMDCEITYVAPGVPIEDVIVRDMFLRQCDWGVA